MTLYSGYWAQLARVVERDMQVCAYAPPNCTSPPYDQLQVRAPRSCWAVRNLPTTPHPLITPLSRCRKAAAPPRTRLPRHLQRTPLRRDTLRPSNRPYHLARAARRSSPAFTSIASHCACPRALTLRLGMARCSAARAPQGAAAAPLLDCAGAVVAVDRGVGAVGLEVWVCPWRSMRWYFGKPITRAQAARDALRVSPRCTHEN